MELTKLEKAESYNAVRSFLKTKDLYYGCNSLEIDLVFQNDTIRHPMNETLEIVYIEQQAIYKFYCNSFYSCKLPNPVWTSFQLFQWNELEDYLFTFHNEYKIIFKRK
jgi:hypothetical protein